MNEYINNQTNKISGFVYFWIKTINKINKINVSNFEYEIILVRCLILYKKAILILIVTLLVIKLTIFNIL